MYSLRCLLLLLAEFVELFQSDTKNLRAHDTLQNGYIDDYYKYIALKQHTFQCQHFALVG